MADTKQQLADKLFNAMEAVSNNAQVDPAQARRDLANDMAQAVFDFVVGRQTQVSVTVQTTGTATAQTGTGTGTGTIQA
jgi:hypothetical protein